MNRAGQLRKLQLVAFVHGLDVGQEVIVVGEADVQSGSGVYALTVALKVSTKIGTSSRRVVAAGSSI
jgi:2-keto-3-deoxy-L-rhamnonate aldolase RhmA